MRVALDPNEDLRMPPNDMNNLKLFLNLQVAAPVYPATFFGGIIRACCGGSGIQRTGKARGHDMAYWSIWSEYGEEQSIV